MCEDMCEDMCEHMCEHMCEDMRWRNFWESIWHLEVIWLKIGPQLPGRADVNICFYPFSFVLKNGGLKQKQSN